MKKHVVILLLVSLLATLCITSCSESKEKSVFLIGGLTEGQKYLVCKDDEINFSSLSSEIQNPQKSRIEIEVNGIKYDCGYKETLVSPLFNDDADIYECANDDGMRLTAYINQKTKALVGYTKMYKNYEDKGLNKTYDECLETAKKALAEFDKDGKYLLLENTHGNKPMNSSSWGKCNDFTFVKEIGNFVSDFTVSFVVNTDGIIMSFDCIHALSISDGEIKIEKDETALKNEIDKVIKSITISDYIGKLTSTVRKTTVAKLKDGKIYLIYDVEVSLSEDAPKDYVKLCRVIVD